jgi:TetR/AcrR family transcriptional regulator
MQEKNNHYSVRRNAAARAPARSAAARLAPRHGAWGIEMPTQEESADIKRGFIVRAAAQCFNRSGFHGTSMDDIAARLGVTKAALYLYVKTKHELLYTAFNMAMDSSFANLDIGDKQGRNGLEKLQITLRGYLCDLIGTLGHPVVLLEEGSLLPEHHRAILQRRDQAEKRFRNLVQEGIADGTITPCNPKLAVFALMGAVNWVPKWYRSDGEWSAGQISDSLVEIITRGIAAQPHSLSEVPTLVEGGVDKRKFNSPSISGD